MSEIYGLTGEQVEKVGIEVKEGKMYFLSIPPVPTRIEGGFKPFIYSNDTINKVVKVEKELTFKEAFAL